MTAKLEEQTKVRAGSAHRRIIGLGGMDNRSCVRLVKGSIMKCTRSSAYSFMMTIYDITVTVVGTDAIKLLPTGPADVYNDKGRKTISVSLFGLKEIFISSRLAGVLELQALRRAFYSRVFGEEKAPMP